MEDPVICVSQGPSMHSLKAVGSEPSAYPPGAISQSFAAILGGPGSSWGFFGPDLLGTPGGL
eukprot:5655903-Pyramimonas_sp.AAC.1